MLLAGLVSLQSHIEIVFLVFPSLFRRMTSVKMDKYVFYITKVISLFLILHDKVFFSLTV